MKKKGEPKNIRLAFYFGLLVVFIIFISLAFKLSDVVRHSRFDGKHTFSVAVLGDNTNVVFVSPQEGTLTNLSISPAVGKDTLTSLGVPTDGYIKSSTDLSSNPKNTFVKALIHRGSIQTDLTILDLLRLSFFTQRTGGDRNIDQKANIKDSNFSDIAEKLFVDPTIEAEKTTITVTNATDTPGLGNKVAKYIGDMGGNVVLVNSSPNSAKQSVLYFKDKNYTIDRISKVLGIKKEMKTSSAISDVTIIIGEDKAGF